MSERLIIVSYLDLLFKKLHLFLFLDGDKIHLMLTTQNKHYKLHTIPIKRLIT